MKPFFGFEWIGHDATNGWLPAKEINYNLVQPLRSFFDRGVRLCHVSFICFVQRFPPASKTSITVG
jgi:hypothetical protein